MAYDVMDNTITIDFSDITTTVGAVGSSVLTTNQSYYYTTGATGSTYSTISDPLEDMMQRLTSIEKIIAELAEEEAIRQSQPSVKRAYDEYKLLLELTRPTKPLTNS